MPTVPIVEQLVVAVVAPMVIAVTARARYPARVGEYDVSSPTISGVMVILIVGGVTAANAAVIRSNTQLLAGIGVLAPNVIGYALGFLVGSRASRPVRIASILSVGMRDFAVAAALILVAGLPMIASLPAVAFGVVEMITGAELVKWFTR